MKSIQTLPRKEAATRFRLHKKLTGGVVILNHGFPTKWLPAMPSPNGWQTGITAVDETGNEWIAQGGNEIDGATEWRQLN